MKEAPNYSSPSSTNQLERPTTTAHRQRTADSGRRILDSRASSVNNDTIERNQGIGRPGVRLTSLSALYQPAFKPYAFSHMYSTKYNQDFHEKQIDPPAALRPDSTNYAPIDYAFNKTMYNQHFQKRKPISLAFVVPYSRHRNNNPQPNMKNNYNYPNAPRWIWSSPTELQQRESVSSQGPETWNRGSRNPYPRQHRWYSR